MQSVLLWQFLLLVVLPVHDVNRLCRDVVLWCWRYSVIPLYRYYAFRYDAIVHDDLSAERFMAVIAAVSHLFPFRTEKLSPLAPMVLQCNAGE